MAYKQKKNMKKPKIRWMMVAKICFCCVASFYLQRQVKVLLTQDLERNSNDIIGFLDASKARMQPSSSVPIASLPETIQLSRNEVSIALRVNETEADQHDDLDRTPTSGIPLNNSSARISMNTLSSSSLGLSKEFPRWMKTYFNWHRKRRLSLNETNWKSQKYLMLRCTHEDKKCGGLADRLKPLPYMILLAARHRRLFMIRWNTPTKLEEFLVPNKLNWSVPDWMEEHLLNDEVSRVSKLTAAKFSNFKKKDKDTMVVEGRIQDILGGAEYYEKTVTDPNETYEKVYHLLFKALFKPSPPIQALIDAKMKTDGLSPGKYAVAHYRAFYGIEGEKHKRGKQQLIHLAINAANCASAFHPGDPVYFASDSKSAVDAVKQYAKTENRPISVLDGDEALHIDKFSPENRTPPSDFYSVFVDLLLMANGNCVTYGQGGFGRFALLLSNNATCFGRHIYKGQPAKCEWKSA